MFAKRVLMGVAKADFSSDDDIDLGLYRRTAPSIQVIDDKLLAGGGTTIEDCNREILNFLRACVDDADSYVAAIEDTDDEKSSVGSVLEDDDFFRAMLPSGSGCSISPPEQVVVC